MAEKDNGQKSNGAERGERKNIENARERVKKSAVTTWVWMGVTLVALVVVVIAILQVNQLEAIDEKYFVEDDTKIVVSMDAETAAFENSEWEAPMTRVVYYVGADGKIENVRVFYEYDTEVEAREAMRHIELGDFAIQKKLNGRYIILQAKPEQYEGATADEVRKNMQGIQEIQGNE